MDKKDIENIIDSKTNESKLLTNEMIIKFLMGFCFLVVAIFGVVYPIWFGIVQSNKIDDELKFYEKKISDLIGTQLRKPELKCYINDKEISDNDVLDFPYELYMKGTIEKKRYNNLRILLKNEGEAPAKNVRVFLYLKERPGLDGVPGGTRFDYYFTDYNPCISDEKEFDIMLRYNFYISDFILSFLDPNESYSVEIEPKWYRYSIPKSKANKDAILKIYYGQPKPLRLKLKINWN